MEHLPGPKAPRLTVMAYVSRQGDDFIQECVWQTCQEILLRFVYYEKQGKGRAGRGEPYLWNPKAPHEFLSPKLLVAVKGQSVAPHRFAKSLRTYWNPIEAKAGLELTTCQKLDGHWILLEADSKWTNNALAMSIWLQVMRGMIKSRRIRYRSWPKFLFENTYFSVLHDPKRLNRVWEKLPSLLAHPFKSWCGNPQGLWTSYCGVKMTLCNSSYSNQLAEWAWKNLWQDTKHESVFKT
jgi:hypothetical protein